jgi:hypothetical protein
LVWIPYLLAGVVVVLGVIILALIRLRKSRSQ